MRLQFLDLKERFDWLHNELEKPCIWQETAKYTIKTCRCQFGNSNKKQMRDFHKDKGIRYSDFLGGRQTFPVGKEACAKKQKKQDKKVVRRLLRKNFRIVQRIQPAASAKHA